MAQTHFALHQPQSLGEAFDLLDVYRFSVRILAGGTDLVPKLKAGALQVQDLVSLRLSARSQVDICAVGVAGLVALDEAGRVAACRPIDDMRASAAYRREMVEVLARRVLAQSLAQAAGPDQIPGGAA